MCRAELQQFASCGHELRKRVQGCYGRAGRCDLDDCDVSMLPVRLEGECHVCWDVENITVASNRRLEAMVSQLGYFRDRGRMDDVASVDRAIQQEKIKRREAVREARRELRSARAAR
jgi:hypothetical protein